MITITALKWVPPFAQGQVRDHRVRWILNEVGWPYKVRLLDTVDQQSSDYRACQPFGQVPALMEESRPPLFETGAILLDVAARSGKLLPDDDDDRSLAVCWLFAALNSIEPTMSFLAQIDFFTEDEDVKAKQRPAAVKAINAKLGQLENSLGAKHYLVGDAFTVADMMTSSVFKIIHHTEILNAYPALAAYRDRCFDRPAYRKAIAEQCQTFAEHRQRDMKYELKTDA